MRHISKKFLAIMALTMAGLANAQNPSELQVGQVIGNEQGQVINGWKQVGGTHYQMRSTQNYVTTEIDECCVTAFKKGNVYLFAVTVPIARRPSGGVEAERITKIRKFVIPTNEQEVDCSIMWIRPVVSFSAGPGKIIRSIVYDGSSFIDFRWFSTGSYCDYGD